MKHVLLTTLRNPKTNTAQFRQAADQLALIMAAESEQFIPQEKKRVQTPFGSTEGFYIPKTPILVPILRAGLVLLPPFLRFYPAAPIGTIGIRRDEKTASPHLYYTNLPPITDEDLIFLLDPMVATGQSATLAVKILNEAGASTSRIVLISILAAPEGVLHVQKHHPALRTYIVQTDEKLNPQKWIVPGLGDFGDRYFGSL